MRKHAAANENGKLMELSKFVLTEMNGNGSFKNFLNGNKRKGNSVNGILFPFPFADRTNGIPQAV